MRLKLLILIFGCLSILGCKKEVLRLNATGSVTDFYSGAPISSGYVIFAPVDNYHNADAGQIAKNPEPYHELPYFAYGADINLDGTYELALEEDYPHVASKQWYVVVYDSNYISETFILNKDEAATIDLVCKPYRVLCVRVDTVSSISGSWNLDVLSDKKLNYYESSVLLGETFYYKVVPDTTTEVWALDRNSTYDIKYTVQITNADTTFYFLEL